LVEHPRDRQPDRVPTVDDDEVAVWNDASSEQR
jgi:hypothetical protein